VFLLAFFARVVYRASAGSEATRWLVEILTICLAGFPGQMKEVFVRKLHEYAKKYRSEYCTGATFA